MDQTPPYFDIHVNLTVQVKGAKQAHLVNWQKEPVTDSEALLHSWKPQVAAIPDLQTKDSSESGHLFL